MSTAPELAPATPPTAATPTPSARKLALSQQSAATRLERSFARCREVTKDRARNFYYGLRLTPEPKRSAIYAIYSWMRDGDDRVDNATSPAAAAAELQRFAHLTSELLAGNHTADPELSGGYWPAFAHTVARYSIERPIIDAMLAGLAEDLAPAAYPTDAELEGYCYRVASTAGLSCLRIWGLRADLLADAATRESTIAIADTKAIARGKAFQLTNILRDIAEDFDASPTRCYLPAAALARHRITAGELRSWSKPASAMGLLDEYIDKARHFYDASAGLEDLVEPDCAGSLWGMTRIYRGLLDLIATDPARVVRGPRARLSTTAKASIALTAFVRSKSNYWPTDRQPAAAASATGPASSGTHTP